MTDGPPELGELLEFPESQANGDQRWLVLFDEDYDQVAIDVEDNVGLKVDIDQAGEVIRLAATALADLSHRDADGDDVLRDMVDRLEAEIGEESDD
jgi:hypothetical protein